MATDPTRTTGAKLVPIANREPILRSGRREISLLVAGENLSVTEAGYAADEHVAGPHVHHLHTDVFYVLEGELTFEIGAESETVMIGAGGFVAAPVSRARSRMCRETPRLPARARQPRNVPVSYPRRAQISSTLATV